MMMPKPPLPVFALLAIGFGDGLRRLATRIGDMDSLTVFVLVILTAIVLCLLKAGPRNA